MTRNLKALGLSLVAVFAMSAMAASAAQATAGHLAWETGATLVTAHQEATGGSQLFKTTAGSVTCDTVTGDASLVGLTNPSASIETTNITYTDSTKEADHCRGPLGTSPEIAMNGCQYKFNAGETAAGKTDTTVGTVDITGCTNADKSITINAGICTIHVKEQNVGPVYYHTILEGGVEKVTIEPKVTNIHYVHTGLCGNGTGTTGEYEGNVIAEAETGTGAARNLKVT